MSVRRLRTDSNLADFGGRSSYVVTMEVPYLRFYRQPQPHFYRALFSLLTKSDPVKKIYPVKPVKPQKMPT